MSAARQWKSEGAKYDPTRTRDQIKAQILADLKEAVRTGDLPRCRTLNAAALEASKACAKARATLKQKAKAKAPKPEAALFETVVEGIGNPDLRQYAPVARKKLLSAASLTGIVQQCLAYIDANRLGGGNWRTPVVFKNGKAFCTVSYNGRCWEYGKEWPHAKEIKEQAP